MHFFVKGEPMAKDRPRVRAIQSGGKAYGQAYTPERTVSYEIRIKEEYERQCGGCEPFTGDVALLMLIVATFPIPMSASKKKKELMRSGALRPHRKDWDNIGKIVCDGLNHIAYYDDTMVSLGIVEKRYGDIPGVDITIIPHPLWLNAEWIKEKLA